ncbi:MAG: Hsp33 family molecular chaperone HslO [Psychromonas sp.]|nr:Hsp33 family molecular chaperone HslO [Psychromonas sp.]
MTDLLQRFIFDDYQTRGEIVNANVSFTKLIKDHKYPIEVEKILGELLIATTLLTATIKFKGKITLQIQGDGPLSMAVVNSDQNLKLRGTATVKGDTKSLSFNDLIGNGHLMITITPEEGDRYQGIVSLEGESLSKCLEHYFKQSEQLATHISLFTRVSNEAKAAGMLLQRLPANGEQHKLDFQYISALASTVKEDEIYSLSNEELLYRLYHQDKVRLFDAQSITYQCSCSKVRCLSYLASVSEQEILGLLNNQGCIDMHCEYCASNYRFTKEDLSTCDINRQTMERTQ